jgi:hypothetical protein
MNLCAWLLQRPSTMAKMLILLKEKDPEGWVVGTYSTIHVASGVGVWTANKVYGLHLYYGCDDKSAKEGLAVTGKEICSTDISLADRRALYKAFGHSGKDAVQKAILAWAIKSKDITFQEEMWSMLNE